MYIYIYLYHFDTQKYTHISVSGNVLYVKIDIASDIKIPCLRFVSVILVDLIKQRYVVMRVYVWKKYDDEYLL